MELGLNQHYVKTKKPLCVVYKAVSDEISKNQFYSNKIKLHPVAQSLHMSDSFFLEYLFFSGNLLLTRRTFHRLELFRILIKSTNFKLTNICTTDNVFKLAIVTEPRIIH